MSKSLSDILINTERMGRDSARERVLKRELTAIYTRGAIIRMYSELSLRPYYLLLVVFFNVTINFNIVSILCDPCLSNSQISLYFTIVPSTVVLCRRNTLLPELVNRLIPHMHFSFLLSIGLMSTVHVL